MKNQTPVSEKIADIEETLQAQGAIDPILMTLPPENSVADAMLVCGSSSRRHAQGIADAIGRVCHEKKYGVLGIEGYETADWILVDCNDVIIHILRDEARQLYRLEDLWAKSARDKETE